MSGSHNSSQPELKHIFDSINGLIFPGGGSDLNATTPLYKSAKYLYDLALSVHTTKSELELSLE